MTIQNFAAFAILAAAYVIWTIIVKRREAAEKAAERDEDDTSPE